MYTTIDHYSSQLLSDYVNYDVVETAPGVEQWERHFRIILQQIESRAGKGRDFAGRDMFGTGGTVTEKLFFLRDGTGIFGTKRDPAIFSNQYFFFNFSLFFFYFFHIADTDRDTQNFSIFLPKNSVSHRMRIHGFLRNRIRIRNYTVFFETLSYSV